MHRKCVEYLKKYPSQQGKKILITGSSSGIGLEAAKEFCYLDAEVYFMVRNEEKARKRIAGIEEELGRKVNAQIILYDQSDPASIKKSIEGIEADHFDVIVLNAGIYFPKVGATACNHPLTLQTNAIGTHLCFDCFFKRYKDARYVFMTSIVLASPKNNDYMPYFEPTYEHRWKQYGLSKKIVKHIFQTALDQGANAYLTHPGVAKTNILHDTAPWLKKAGQAFLTMFTHPAWKAALGILEASLADAMKGAFYGPRGVGQISGYPKQVKYKPSEKETKAWLEAYRLLCE